jgi:hypothetical protein
MKMSLGKEIGQAAIGGRQNESEQAMLSGEAR